MPDTCKPFSTSSTALEESPNPSRDIAPSSIPGHDSQHPVMNKPQQSSEQNDRSKLVTPTTRPGQETSTERKDDEGYIRYDLIGMFREERKEIFDLLKIEKKEKASLQKEKASLQKEKMERIAKKKQKIQELKNRAKEREAYIQKMEYEIKKLEEELCEARDALEDQKKLAEKVIASKESEICTLQKNISQKEMELKEPDEKREQCDQLASAEPEHKVARPHQQSHQANVDLENEKKTNEQFEEASQHIMNLRKNISTAHDEIGCLEEMVEWAEDNLVQEEEEIEIVEEMMRGKMILRVYRVVVVFMWMGQVVILVAFLCIMVVIMLPRCI